MSLTIFNKKNNNVGGLRRKTDGFPQALMTSHYDIIVLIEKWVTENTSNRELNLSKYARFRSDRCSNVRGRKMDGGAMVAIRDRLIPRRLTYVLRKYWTGVSFCEF